MSDEQKPCAIPDFEQKVQEKLDEFEPHLKQLDGARYMIVRDSVYDYCRIAVMLDFVTEKVRNEGFTVVNNKGRTERNPDVMTMHQLANEKNALLPKIMKYIPTGDEGYVDGLVAFIKE